MFLFHSRGLKRNFSSSFTHPIWLDFYSQPSADFKMLISLKCDYVLRNALREEPRALANANIRKSHPIQDHQDHLERGDKKDKILQVYFLFSRKVDKNAPKCESNPFILLLNDR